MIAYLVTLVISVTIFGLLMGPGGVELALVLMGLLLPVAVEDWMTRNGL
jgi:hypothetical protein